MFSGYFSKAIFWSTTRQQFSQITYLAWREAIMENIFSCLVGYVDIRIAELCLSPLLPGISTAPHCIPWRVNLPAADYLQTSSPTLDKHITIWWTPESSIKNM